MQVYQYDKLPSMREAASTFPLKTGPPIRISKTPKELARIEANKFATLNFSVDNSPRVGFNIQRTLRYSSKAWESNPRFVQQLFRFNQLDHLNFNPALDSKAFRLSYQRALGVQVPLVHALPSRVKVCRVEFKSIDDAAEVKLANLERDP